MNSDGGWKLLGGAEVNCQLFFWRDSDNCAYRSLAYRYIYFHPCNVNLVLFNRNISYLYQVFYAFFPISSMAFISPSTVPGSVCVLTTTRRKLPALPGA